MKRIAYLILTSLALTVCSCSVNAPETVPSDTTECCIPKTLNVCVSDPQTKMSIGDLDPATNTYPIKLTPYNYDDGTGDVFLVYGVRGEIADFSSDKITMEGVYRVESVRNNISTLLFDGVPEAFGESFAAADYFIMINQSYTEMEQFDDKEIGSGIVLANWFTKAEILRMIDELPDDDSEQAPVLPIYPLTSLLKLHVTVPQMDEGLMLNGLAAYTPGACPRKLIDFRRLPQMIEEKAFYGDYAGDNTYTYTSQSVTDSGELDVYVSIDPGHYDSMRLEFSFADNAFTYEVKVDSKRGFEVEGGKMYTSSLTISMDQMMAGRELVPVIAVGSETFWFSDPDNENALPLKEKLASSSVILAGYGRQSDFTSDVMGKVAVVSRGEISFADKIINAQNAGAVGLIVYNNQPDVLYMDITSLYGKKHIPAIATTQEFGQYLIGHPDEKVSIWTDISDMENAIGK